MLPAESWWITRAGPWRDPISGASVNPVRAHSGPVGSRATGFTDHRVQRRRRRARPSGAFTVLSPFAQPPPGHTAGGVGPAPRRTWIGPRPPRRPRFS